MEYFEKIKSWKQKEEVENFRRHGMQVRKLHVEHDSTLIIVSKLVEKAREDLLKGEKEDKNLETVVQGLAKDREGNLPPDPFEIRSRL